jgi:hypothetical protein
MSMRFMSSDDPREIARQARRLADALDRLAADDGPSAADLTDAPILTDWRKVARAAPALAGIVSGHPLIAQGRLSVTSEVFAIDGGGTWARTWSRFYRLGSPARDGRPQ